MNNGHTSLDPSANVDPRTGLQSGWGEQAGSAAALICDTGEMLDYLKRIS
jgi:hypothetical protein